MSGSGSFTFDPERLAALGRLSAEINAQSAPPPIDEPIMLDAHGRVLLPVPNHPAAQPDFVRSLQAMFERKKVWCQLHAGMTLQWAPMLEAGGMLLEVRGGAPDGDENRDGVAAFLTPTGLRGLISDLQAIAVAIEAEQA